MNRNKKIIIACLIAMTFILITNYIINTFFKEEQYSVYALNQVILQGENLSLDKLDKVQVNKKYDYIDDNNIDIYIEKYVAKEDLNKGQVLSKEILKHKE